MDYIDEFDFCYSKKQRCVRALANVYANSRAYYKHGADFEDELVEMLENDIDYDQYEEVTVDEWMQRFTDPEYDWKNENAITEIRYFFVAAFGDSEYFSQDQADLFNKLVRESTIGNLKKHGTKNTVDGAYDRLIKLL